MTYKNLGSECVVPGCVRDAKTRGWCRMHYRRWLVHGRAGEAAPRVARNMDRDPVCVEPGCGKKHDALGFCKTHYKRYRYGKKGKKKEEGS